MNALVERFLADPLGPWAARGLLESALAHFYAFTLVLVRMSGLMTVGPLFGQAIVPANIRVLLVVALTFLVTPTISEQSRLGFDRLDANGDGRLTRDEIPESLLPLFDRKVEQQTVLREDSLTYGEFAPLPRIPDTLIDYTITGIGEFSLGFVLGLGVLTILSGLQLAGQLVDQQTGIGLGDVFSPGFEMTGSITGQFLFLLGLVLFLVLEPVNGHLMMVAALIETFQTLPVGEAWISASIPELLRDLLHQSFILAVQVTAPVMAVMSLVALSMGFLGHTVPQVNVLVVGFPIRALVNLVVLAASLSGAARAIVDTLPAVIDQLRLTLTGLG